MWCIMGVVVLVSGCVGGLVIFVFLSLFLEVFVCCWGEVGLGGFCWDWGGREIL